VRETARERVQEREIDSILAANGSQQTDAISRWKTEYIYERAYM